MLCSTLKNEAENSRTFYLRVPLTNILKNAPLYSSFHVVNELTNGSDINELITSGSALANCLHYDALFIVVYYYYISNK